MRSGSTYFIVPANAKLKRAEETSHMAEIIPIEKQPEQSTEYVAPYNLEAEQSLLGAILLNNNAYEKVSDYLTADHFYDPINRKVYEGATRLIQRGQIADPITLKDYFRDDEQLKPVGGPQYLVDLASSVLSTANVHDYGKLIYDLFIRRELVDIGQEMSFEAKKPQLALDAHNQIETSEKRLYDLAMSGQTSGGFVDFSSALTEAINSAEAAFKRDSKIVGVTTGFEALDKTLGGMHNSDLIILAGRPSMGKTALATNIAFNAAKAHMQSKGSEGSGVAFFSLEMSAEQLAGRILSSESEVTSDRIRRGDLNAEEYNKLVETSRQLASLPLYIDDTPAISVTAVRNRARRLKRLHGIGMIMVDYLQLLQGSNGSKGAENRVNEISDITRSLKAIAKELNVPVLALSQLSRQVEQREDKRPQLADLRESGSIEQDSDVVMFIFREEYYESRREPAIGTAEYLEWQQRMERVHSKADVIIAKQRHGPIGTKQLYFNGNLVKFGNLLKNETNH